jgi:hypothetical protein
MKSCAAITKHRTCRARGERKAGRKAAGEKHTRKAYKKSSRRAVQESGVREWCKRVV